jgi:hypothetical protein
VNQAPAVRLEFGARHQPIIISKERMMAAKTKRVEKS